MDVMPSAAGVVHITVVHRAVRLWCGRCAKSSGVCLRGYIGDRWFTFRRCVECHEPLDGD